MENGKEGGGDITQIFMRGGERAVPHGMTLNWNLHFRLCNEHNALHFL